MNATRGRVVRKKATIRHSKSKDYLIAIKNHGTEPELPIGAGNLDFIKAFNWYSYVCTPSDARTFLNDYLKVSSREDDIKKLQSVPDQLLPLTAAWIARLEMKYHHLVPSSFKETFERGLSKSFTYCVEPMAPSTRPSIRDRMKDRASDLLGEMEGLLDDRRYDTNVYDWLKEHKVASTYVPTMIRKYQPLLEEVVLALRGGDQQVKEAYKNQSKKELHAQAEFLIYMLKDMKRYGTANKTIRRAVSPRVVSVEKKLKSFKYMTDSSEWKAASIGPQKIIGASELWTFDTKYKKLTVLRAPTGRSLDIKGTKVTGWDQATSLTVSTGRKTQDIVASVVASGKIALRKMIEELKPAGYTQERISDRILLLRAF